MKKKIAGSLVLVSLALSGCSSETGGGLEGEYGSGSGQNYVSEDGAVLEIAVENRAGAVDFSGPLDNGGSLSSSELLGNVVVINFWYAGCPPCRAEAKDLEAANQFFAEQNVTFLGVNVRDQVSTARAFSESYGISYPSIMDIETADAQLAFAGVVPPNSVPTTLVLDRKGSVAARILGIIEGATLRAIVNSVLAEGS